MNDVNLSIDGITKSYGELTALHPLSVDIAQGSYVVLLGPSGSGKTTLLSILGGFVPPTSGSLRVAGQDITRMPPARRPTTTVFQDYALFPNMNVAANVRFGLDARKVAAAEATRRVDDVLRLVGLQGYGERSIAALSGGQRQRVALARALAVEPEILLLDEPLGALDLQLRRQMQDELKRIQVQSGRTFIHVTHDQEEALALADVVAVMNHGRMEDLGPPERLYSRPASRFCATFLGESNLLEGTVRKVSVEHVQIETPFGPLLATGQASEGSRMTACIRPERLRLAVPGATALQGLRVIETVFQGTFVRVRVVNDHGDQLLAKLPPEQVPVLQETVSLSYEPAHASLIPT